MNLDLKPTQKFKIFPGNVHLWHVNDEEITNNELIASYTSYLSKDELEQHNRFHFEGRRHQYLITRMLVRYVMSLYSDIAAEDFIFAKNDYGKPFVKNQNIRIDYNLSHTKKMIVLAVTVDADIGVDVEYLDRKTDCLKLAKSMFSKSEYTQLCELPSEKKKEHFFDIWTLKESYIKARGMGLSIPLGDISYSLDDTGITVFFESSREDDPDSWKFWNIQVNSEHKISLAIKKKDTDLIYEISMLNVIPLSDIVKTHFSINRQSC